MNEKQTTVQVEGWGIVRFPTRWLDLNAMQWDVHALDADHILAPGCVDLSCLDSIHALANLANDLWDDGILNDLVAEAFNPALAPPRVCPCGHSACCQNFIDTGDAGCIEGGE